MYRTSMLATCKGVVFSRFTSTLPAAVLLARGRLEARGVGRGLAPPNVSSLQASLAISLL